MARFAIARRRRARTFNFAPRTRTRTRIVSVARRGASKAGRVALEESHTVAAVVAAGALGYAKKNGMLDKIPYIDAIGVAGTLGAVAFIAGRKFHSKHLSHAATGFLAIAMYEWASEDGAMKGDDDGGNTVDGDDDY